MRTINILDEFINLSYSRKNIIQKEGDVDLGNYILLRMTKSSWYIYFLTSGNSLEIPISYISLFSELEVYHQGNIFQEGISHRTKLEDFIYYMLMFIHSVQSKEYDKAITSIDKVTRLGTKDFREYMNQHLGINFGEIYYSSLNNNVYL